MIPGSMNRAGGGGIYPPPFIVIGTINVKFAIMERPIIYAVAPGDRQAAPQAPAHHKTTNGDIMRDALKGALS